MHIRVFPIYIASILLFGHVQHKGNILWYKGSNPFICRFCSLILNCLFLATDTWPPKAKKHVVLEAKGLQAKNAPAQSEQLTTIVHYLAVFRPKAFAVWNCPAVTCA